MDKPFILKPNYTIDDLTDIMARLRSPEGCPWDKEQTHQSIRPNFLEEVYEAVEAIDCRDDTMLCEELGDVLLQIVFHAQMAKEAGSFNFDSVCDGICKKLILRHPHIFGDVQVENSTQVLANWDAIKRKEKGHATAHQTLQAVPKALPGLMRSSKVQGRAAKVGFDYPDIHWALQDLQSELAELQQALEAGNREEVHQELGDLLFSAVNVARFAGVDAEQAVGDSCEKFIARFGVVEQLAQEQNIEIRTADIQTLIDLWKQAKVRIGNS